MYMGDGPRTIKLYTKISCLSDVSACSQIHIFLGKGLKLSIKFFIRKKRKSKLLKKKKKKMLG